MNFRRHMRGSELPLFQIAPLLTVALLLLCLFVGAAMLPPATREAEVVFPMVANGQSVKHHAGELIVSIAATGAVTVNRQVLPLEELRSRLQQLSHEMSESAVLVHADREAPFATILCVVEACRSAEIDYYQVVAAPGESDATTRTEP